MAFLIIEERGHKQHLPLSSEKVTLGRAPDNDIVLSDEKSSRHHAVIEAQGAGYLYRDLGSRNGSFVGELKVREHKLLYGDCIRIGNALVRFESEESTAFETAAGMEIDPIAASADESQSGGLVIVDEMSWDKVLGLFSSAAIKPDAKTFLDIAVKIVSAIVSEVRVVLVEDNADIPRVLSSAQFITNNPLDELEQGFAKSVRLVLKDRKPVFGETSEGRSCGHIPILLHDGSKLLLYIEAESKTRRFSDSERTTILATQPLVAALAGIGRALAERSQYKDKVATLERELVELREDLQQRIDLQTADLSRREGSLAELTPKTRLDYSGIIGRAPKMQGVFALLDKVTDLPVPVLINGESGTGKDLIARALHENSKRATVGQYVAENCAAMPETLLESELFGYVKGAFTGADRDKVGLFETADQGTIFLDEIGETTPAFQAKLLRVLEDGVFRPVGSNKVKHANFRLVCATNRSLEEMVKEGSFRQDLYYRINVMKVNLPPLRERREDIPALVDHFLKIAAKENNDEPKKTSAGVMRAMMEYAWPGNVRELENEVKRMVALSDGDKIGIEELSPALRGAASAVEFSADDDMPLKELVEIVEKRRIEEVLKRTEGNKSKASEILGLSRLGLRKKMDRYGLGDNQD